MSDTPDQYYPQERDLIRRSALLMLDVNELLENGAIDLSSTVLQSTIDALSEISEALKIHVNLEKQRLAK